MRKLQSVKEQKILEAYRLSCLQRDQQAAMDTQQDCRVVDQNIIDLNGPSSGLLKSIQKPDILIKGVLDKKTHSELFHIWHPRFCELNHSKFCYHETADPTSPQDGVLNLDAVSVDLEIGFNLQKEIVSFKVIPKHTNKQFVFRGHNNDQTSRWVKLLMEAVHDSLGYKMYLASVCKEPNFWKKDYELEAQFRRNAQTGDLVLFRSNKTQARIQRTVTWANYDHVGILLKNDRGQLIIFEATGGVGVGLLPWQRFIQRGWHKLQAIIAYRHLRIARGVNFYEMMERFVNENIGRKYSFSLDKIFKKVSIAPNGINSLGKEDYFCSQLVASAYKYLGILPQQKSASQYWPRSFEEDSQLELKVSDQLGRAELGRETIIVFEDESLPQTQRQSDSILNHVYNVQYMNEEFHQVATRYLMQRKQQELASLELGYDPSVASEKSLLERLQVDGLIAHTSVAQLMEVYSSVWEYTQSVPSQSNIELGLMVKEVEAQRMMRVYIQNQQTLVINNQAIERIKLQAQRVENQVVSVEREALEERRKIEDFKNEGLKLVLSQNRRIEFSLEKQDHLVGFDDLTEEQLLRQIDQANKSIDKVIRQNTGGYQFPMSKNQALELLNLLDGKYQEALLR